jgi:hypothetical protein
LNPVNSWLMGPTTEPASSSKMIGFDLCSSGLMSVSKFIFLALWPATTSTLLETTRLNLLWNCTGLTSSLQLICLEFCWFRPESETQPSLKMIRFGFRWFGLLMPWKFLEFKRGAIGPTRESPLS